MGRKPRRISPPPADWDEDTPFTAQETKRGRIAWLVLDARRRSGLDHGDFAERYGIPERDLRDWERGITQPDVATLNYLKVIAKMPAEVSDIIRGAA